MRFSHLDPEDREWQERFREASADMGLYPLPTCSLGEVPHEAHPIGTTPGGKTITCLGISGYLLRAPETVEDWEEVIPLTDEPSNMSNTSWLLGCAMWGLLLALLCGTIVLVVATVRGGN